jgi:hypothetical protein
MIMVETMVTATDFLAADMCKTWRQCQQREGVVHQCMHCCIRLVRKYVSESNGCKYVSDSPAHLSRGHHERRSHGGEVTQAGHARGRGTGV